MRTEVWAQAAALFEALVTGSAFGLFYDLLRPLRRRAGRFAAALLDVLFCLVSGAAAFFYAMGAGEGRLGICQLFAMTGGFLLYIYLFSDKIAAGLQKLTAPDRKI